MWEQGQGLESVSGELWGEWWWWSHVTIPGDSMRVQIWVYCIAHKLIYCVWANLKPLNPLTNHISPNHHCTPIKALPNDVTQKEQGRGRGTSSSVRTSMKTRKQLSPWPHFLLLSQVCSGSHLGSNAEYGRSELWGVTGRTCGASLSILLFPSQGWPPYPSTHTHNQIDKWWVPIIYLPVFIFAI